MLAVTLAGVGCRNEEGNGSDPTPAAAPAAHANEINAVPREKLQDGGTFTRPLDQMPPQFNYHELDGTLQDNAHVIER
jgi:peptide/nickel transport system substrate-binding protein